MAIFTSILIFVVTVLALISVHEFGHFWVAKRLGVKVLRFSIGFGKALFRWHGKDGVEYIVAWLPLGGYVKLLDEREGKVKDSEKHLAFNRKPLFTRFAVVIAGPLTNFLFAILMFWIMLVIGVEQIKPVIGQVVANSIAATAGIVSGSQVITVDETPTPNWQAVMLAVVERMGETGKMNLKAKLPSHELKSYQLNLASWENKGLNPAPLEGLGIVPYFPPVPPVIKAIQPDTPAAKVGLRVGDKILKVDQRRVTDWFDFVTLIQKKSHQTVKLRISRNGKLKTITVTPAEKRISLFNKIGFLGVKSQPPVWPEDLKYIEQYPVWIAWWVAWQKAWRLFAFNFIVLGKLIIGQISLSSLGGPITIYRAADLAFAQGLTIYLGFLGLVSVMLAFVNVLPIPGLDGGHLLYYIIEFIRGKPLTDRVQTLVLRLGFIFLIVIMIQATVNDVMRLM